MPADSERRRRFTDLFHAHYGDVVAYAHRRMSDGSDAEDVANETFTVAWRRFEEIRPEVPLAWLYAIARRVLANRRRGDLRRRNLVERIAGAMQSQDDVAMAAPAPDASDVLVALSRLSAADQELLRLVAWEGLTNTEIAVVVGASPNAVAVRVHRARRRLAQKLMAPMKDAAPSGHIRGEGRMALPPEEDW